MSDRPVPNQPLSCVPQELRSINAMVKPSAESRSKAAVPRLRSALQASEDEEPEPKRYKARLRDVLDQRQANVGE